MNPYLDLFLTFAQIGVCTFGGGYAMLPILQREVVEKRGWATEDELMDYYAIGQCTPGVIAVNTSTFIGYRLRGVSGAITVISREDGSGTRDHRDRRHGFPFARHHHDHRCVHSAVRPSCRGAARLCRHPHRGLRARAAKRVENGEKGCR